MAGGALLVEDSLDLTPGIVTPAARVRRAGAMLTEYGVIASDLEKKNRPDSDH